MTPEPTHVDFDPYGSEYASDPAAVNGRLRECSVARSPHHGGFWSVARHEDVVQAFKHDGRELSARHETLPDGLVLNGVLLPPSPAHLGFMECDPPLHKAVRRLMHPWFTNEAAEAMRPRLEEVAAALLNAHVETGRLDARADLMEPLATFVTFELLGLPVGDIPRYSLHAQLHPGYEPESVDGELLDIFGVVRRALADEIKHRTERNEPGLGLLGHMLSQTIDGQPIPHDLLVDTILLFVIAGADTVAGAFTGAIYYLACEPEDRRRLREDRSLLPTAFEEFVRYETPTTQNARTALEDFELVGTPISRGDVVYLNLLAANHDEQRFSSPETVILDRQPNPHVGFGVGTHRCIGAQIARVEWCVMMNAVLDRLGDWTVLEDPPPRVAHRGISNLFERMPIGFRPGTQKPVGSEVLDRIQTAFPDVSGLLSAEEPC